MRLESTAPELPLVVARPSVVVGHTRLGCLPSASIYWFYRDCDALRRLTCPLESRDDVVPVDWLPRRWISCYSSRCCGTGAITYLLGKPAVSPGWRLYAFFARWYGERPDTPYQVVDIPTILRERERARQLLGPGDYDQLFAVLPLYYRFMEMDAEIFDNTRLLEEGMAPPPKLASYLESCAMRPADRSVYDQMLDDI